jgi:hypothetical protein
MKQATDPYDFDSAYHSCGFDRHGFGNISSLRPSNPRKRVGALAWMDRSRLLLKDPGRIRAASWIKMSTEKPNSSQPL